ADYTATKIKIASQSLATTLLLFFFVRLRPHQRSTLFPYTTLFRSIYATPATIDLCGIILPDSGHLQEEDAEFYNRHKKNSASSRSEEHTSELQSRGHLVCRLLLEKKK